MFMTDDIEYISKFGIDINVTKDKNNRLTLQIFDFSTLDIIGDTGRREIITAAIENFILRFVAEVNLKDTLDKFMGRPITDGLIFDIKYTIEQKMDYYEHINGIDFSRLLGIHIMNYVHGHILELETGHVH